MTVPFVDLKTQFKNLQAEMMPAMQSVLERTAFILGSDLEEFEKSFAEYAGAKYCVGVANGTEALHVAAVCLDLGPGDEVLVPANTYIASALGMAYTGAKVVPVDMDPDTYLIDSKLIEAAITSKTKAIVPVHLFGRQVDMDPILEIAKKYNLKVIEDSAQSHGAKLNGHTSGSAGDIGCFSFYPGKNLGCYGDGGAIVTNDESLYLKAKAFRHLGQAEKNIHSVKGLNCRLDTLQAAVLNVKMKYIHEWSESRYENATKYNHALEGIGDLILPQIPVKGSHVFHLYIIQTEKRDELLEYLNENGIQAGIHYPTPIHMHEAFSDIGKVSGDYPVAEKFANNILSLPMFPELSEAQIATVKMTIENFFAQ